MRVRNQKHIHQHKGHQQERNIWKNKRHILNIVLFLRKLALYSMRRWDELVDILIFRSNEDNRRWIVRFFQYNYTWNEMYIVDMCSNNTI